MHSRLASIVYDGTLSRRAAGAAVVLVLFACSKPKDGGSHGDAQREFKVALSRSPDSLQRKGGLLAVSMARRDGHVRPRLIPAPSPAQQGRLRQAGAGQAAGRPNVRRRVAQGGWRQAHPHGGTRSRGESPRRVRAPTCHPASVKGSRRRHGGGRKARAHPDAGQALSSTRGGFHHPQVKLALAVSTTDAPVLPVRYAVNRRACGRRRRDL
jgi:hypothetical protein